MSLTTLPDLCLLRIFDRIPLYDLLATVNRVCHRWKTMRPIACHRRRSLILVEDRKIFDYLFAQTPYSHNDGWLSEITNDDGTPYYRPNLDYQFEYNCLVMSNMSEITCQQLVTLLPNISSLQIGQYVTVWSTQIEQIKYLLEGWSTSLVHLNLQLRTTFDQQISGEIPEENLLDLLYDKINLLSNLKTFKIFLQLPLYCYQNLKTKMRFLSHLEQFDYSETTGLYHRYIIRNLEDALKDSSNCALKRISLGEDTVFGPVLHNYSDELSALLTHCWFGYRADFDKLSLASLRLKSLEILSIVSFANQNLSYAKFVSVLSNLTQLIVLKLHYFPEAFLPTVKVVPHHQILSMKALDIRFQYTLSHSHIDNLSLSETFPNLQVIRLSHHSDQCDECGYELADVEPELFDMQQTRECHRRMVQPLKLCTKVGNIYFRQMHHAGNVDNVFTNEQL